MDDNDKMRVAQIDASSPPLHVDISMCMYVWKYSIFAVFMTEWVGVPLCFHFPLRYIHTLISDDDDNDDDVDDDDDDDDDDVDDDDDDDDAHAHVHACVCVCVCARLCPSFTFVHPFTHSHSHTRQYE